MSSSYNTEFAPVLAPTKKRFGSLLDIALIQRSTMKLDGMDVHQLALNGLTGALLGLLYQFVFTYTERRVPSRLPIAVEALYHDADLVTRFNLLHGVVDDIDNVALFRAIDRTDDLLYLYYQLKNKKCTKSTSDYDDTLALQYKKSISRALDRLEHSLVRNQARASKIVRFQRLKDKIVQRLCEYQSAIHSLSQKPSV